MTTTEERADKAVELMINKSLADAFGYLCVNESCAFAYKYFKKLDIIDHHDHVGEHGSITGFKDYSLFVTHKKEGFTVCKEQLKPFYETLIKFRELPEDEIKEETLFKMTKAVLCQKN